MFVAGIIVMSRSTLGLEGQSQRLLGIISLGNRELESYGIMRPAIIPDVASLPGTEFQIPSCG